MDIQIINPPQPENIEERVKGEIIVTFRPEQAAGQDINELSSRFADEYGIATYRTFPSINTCAYKVPVGKEEELIERLKQEPCVENAELSHYFRAILSGSN